MENHEFMRRYPKLFHLAAGNAWGGLSTLGLRSARSLVGMAGVAEDDQRRLLRERREGPESLKLPEGQTAVLTDQRPLNVTKLASALDNMEVADWLWMLNGMCFLYPSEDEIATLQKAAHAEEPVVVLTLNSRPLVEHFGSLIRLASINTGAVLYGAARRGPRTFLSIDQFPKTKKVKEVALLSDIPDLTPYLHAAETRFPDGSSQPLS